jgi:uncharacterized damage-inducible protein DinB
MTPILETIASNFRTTSSVLSLALSDLKGRDAWKRIRNGEGPSIAWEVGHMLDFRCQALGLLGSAKEGSYAAQFAGGSELQASEYLEQWKRIEEELGEAMARATQESLKRAAGSGPHGEQTVLDKIAFVAWHEASHIGTLGAIRKAMGYPSPAELVMAMQASHAAV